MAKQRKHSKRSRKKKPAITFDRSIIYGFNSMAEADAFDLAQQSRTPEERMRAIREKCEEFKKGTKGK